MQPQRFDLREESGDLAKSAGVALFLMGVLCGAVAVAMFWYGTAGAFK